MSHVGWYHLSVKPIQRSAGRSVVAAAAYRLAARLEDREYGELRDYSRRGGVLDSFTIAPGDAPDWTHDPERLWNAAASADRRINSQLAREFELALPASVSELERERIAHEFAQALVNRYGVAVSVAIHAPSRGGDGRNYHAHMLATTRAIGADGFGRKTRILDDRQTGPQEIRVLRQLAADLINHALARAGSGDRVDARSLRDRQIDREPTEHLGVTASAIERRGGASERGDRNREVQERNRVIGEWLAETLTHAAKHWLGEEKPAGDGDGDGLADADAEEDEPPPQDDASAAFRFVAREDSDAEADDQPNPAVPTLDGDWQQQKRAARDAIAGAEPFAEQMRASGEIRHHGIGCLGWWQHAGMLARGFFDNAKDWAGSKWVRYVASRRFAEGAAEGAEREL